MNLHFEDRQKLRALAQPVEPRHDLWTEIAARIEREVPAPRRHFRWLALAASLACVAVLSGVIGVRLLHSNTAAHIAGQPGTITQLAANAGTTARWRPGDPRLRGAAIELRAAQGELRQALAIAPHSEYLQQLLDRTEHQQMRLRHLDLGAG